MVENSIEEYALGILDPEQQAMRTVSLRDSAGQVRLLNVINSLDTSVCHIETRKWQQIRADLPVDVVVYTISMDLPFAQSRFCGAEAPNVTTLSTMRGGDFMMAYGVAITSGPLAGITARAVVVLDEANKVIHAELVPEIKQEPNYDAALAVL